MDGDLEAGTITFGNKSYPVQFLGTESYISDTFLWGWKNINYYPEEFIALAKEMKKFGIKNNVEVLTIDTFELDNLFNGHNISIVTTGLEDNKYAYYKDPYDNGAAFLVFSDVDPIVFEPVDSIRFSNIISKSISEFDVNHKILTESYLVWNKTPYKWDGNTIIADFEDNNLLINFEIINNEYRIASLKSENK